MTKQLRQWRGFLLGLVIFLTMLALSFRFANGRIIWTFLQETPPLVTALVLTGALICWVWLSLCAASPYGARR
jgi:hypothetical protein